MTKEQREWIGVAITVVSIGISFLWGIELHVFGRAFDLKGHPVATLGFFGWIVAAIFGVGFGHGGVRPAVKAAAAVMLLFVSGAIIGVLRGNYR
jgi:hypothetical protein